MTDKPKRKGLKCPECNHGMLHDTTFDCKQCDICLIYFNTITIEPLNELTIGGASNALGYEVQLLKNLVIEELLAPFKRLWKALGG